MVFVSICEDEIIHTYKYVRQIDTSAETAGLRHIHRRRPLMQPREGPAPQRRRVAVLRVRPTVDDWLLAANVAAPQLMPLHYGYRANTLRDHFRRVDALAMEHERPQELEPVASFELRGCAAGYEPRPGLPIGAPSASCPCDRCLYRHVAGNAIAAEAHAAANRPGHFPR